VNGGALSGKRDSRDVAANPNPPICSRNDDMLPYKKRYGAIVRSATDRKI